MVSFVHLAGPGLARKQRTAVGVLHSGIQGAVSSDLGDSVYAHASVRSQGAERVTERVHVIDGFWDKRKVLRRAVFIRKIKILLEEPIDCESILRSEGFDPLTTSQGRAAEVIEKMKKS